MRSSRLSHLCSCPRVAGKARYEALVIPNFHIETACRRLYCPDDSFFIIGAFRNLLDICSIKPMTGFYRDGCCDTGREDVGSHTICVVMTSDFLEFSKSHGNDLSASVPEFGFRGLKPGDRWCLCAPRWQEAFEAGQAPRVILRASHEGALAHCSLADLKRFAMDLA